MDASRAPGSQAPGSQAPGNQARDSGQLSKTAAEVYEEFFVPALFGEWAPRVCEAARVAKGTSLLDVACGTGCVAREAARRIGSDHKQAERAYRTGMRGFQDDYATAVSARFGHERVGPRRRRLRRDALLARQGAVMVTTALSELTRGLMAHLPVPDPDTPLRPDVMNLHKLPEACAELSAQLQAGRPPDLDALMALIEDIDGRATTGTGASQQESWAADSWEDPNRDIEPPDCESEVDPDDDIDPEAGPDWDVDLVDPGEDDPEPDFPDEPAPDEDTSW